MVTVFPHAIADDDIKALEEFTTQVRAVTPHATGGSVMMVEGGRTVVTAFKEAGGLAVLFVFGVLMLSLRSMRDTFLVFTPLAIAALITVGISVAIRIPLNYANLIALPLLFSLGVSYGIYLVWRWRTSHDVTALMNTVTPRAILYSGLTTIASFGSLMVSEHRGAASMGIMLVVAISLAIAVSLILLPALMNIQDRWEEIKKNEPSWRKAFQKLMEEKPPPTP